MTNIELQTLSAVKSAALSIDKELGNDNSESLAIKAALAVLPVVYKDIPTPEQSVKRSLEVGLEFAKQIKSLKV